MNKLSVISCQLSVASLQFSVTGPIVSSHRCPAVHLLVVRNVVLALLTAVWLTAIGNAQTAPVSSYLELVRQARIKRTDHEPAAAAALWERALELNPTDGRNWSEYGATLLELKDYRRALTAYEKALELGSGYPWEQLYNIARCYVLDGDKQQGLKWLERAVNEGYRNLNIIRANRELDPIREDPRFKELLGIADVGKMSRDEGWRFDLRFLAREIKRLHYDPYRRVSRQVFDDYVKQLNAAIPSMTEPQIVVGLMKLAAMAGDGHTGFRHPAYGPETKTLLPVQFYLFQEGLFILSAAPEQAALVGSQVVALGGHPIDQLMIALDPIISRDNSIWPKLVAPGFMRNPYLLYGLKLIPDVDKVALTIRDRSGNDRTVTLAATAGVADETWITARKDATGPEPLYLRNRKAAYWFEYVPEQKLAWLQYNAIAHDPKEPFPEFCQRVFKFINENAVEKLVVDLRWNGGGNTFLSQPLVRALIGNEKINQRGKLFIIVGRNTFSAAMNTSTLIERHTNAIFVGEPTGSSPNFIGESIRVELPYSKMTGTVSDLYWQTSWPMDHRPWIPPLLYAPPTFASYRQNRDPALEAILEYREP
ncbi:MAG: tetratricopeptide repeat protein [Acidobacteriota bacterium]